MVTYLSRYLKSSYSSLIYVVSIQGVLIGVNFLCGILNLRFLSKSEYALYVIINSIIAILNILSDSGITSGVLIEGAKCWNDPQKLANVICSAKRIRVVYALISSFLVLPYYFFVLREVDVSTSFIVIINILLILNFVYLLNFNIENIPFKLNNEHKFLQNVQLKASGIKLFGSLLIYIIPSAICLTFFNTLSSIFSGASIKPKLSTFLSSKGEFSKDVKKTIFSTTAKILPLNIYYIFSGQIITFILSLKGDLVNIANLGALGAVGIIYSLFRNVFSQYINPMFSKYESKDSAIKAYYRINLANFILAFGVVFILYTLKEVVFFILGPKYEGLSHEFIIALVATAINYISATSLSMWGTKSKSYIMRPSLYVSVNILVIAGLLWKMNLDTLNEYVYFSFYLSFANIIINLLFNFYILKKVKAKWL